MKFIIGEPSGHAANGAVLYRPVTIVDERREDLGVAAKRIEMGRMVPQGARTIELGNPLDVFQRGPVYSLAAVIRRPPCLPFRETKC